ncbi:collagenase [Actinokineospora cianjurensis]|uniref:microbial collagenase n=1 Tax=Actinokineospora cianjurensis TaxID=585224 RepID=A0A421B236_9PSEU|nr:collagenase [Actinokineospora cianjurensis]RLK58496.1 collagenase [Actinokineospora cianjurensis]
MSLSRVRKTGPLVLLISALTLLAAVITPLASGQSAPAQRGTLPPSAGAVEEADHIARERIPVAERAPASKTQQRRDYDAQPRAALAACDTSGFTSRTGWALVDFIRSSTTDCVNSLFSLTGTDATRAFREDQMTYVAYGLRDNGSTYPGNNTTGTAQLVLYLRAGYYVQWYNPDVVGPYGSAMRSAIRSGLDSFFANSRAFTVSDANGESLSEAVTLIDSAQENARYLFVVKRLLDGYNTTYDSSWHMLNAVNNVYTVLFRGHQVPEFVTAITADPSVLETLRAFAIRNLGLLAGDRAYLTSNAGRELGRFLQHPALLATARPKAKALTDVSSIRGTTAPLWVGVAEMVDGYDKANCAYYGACDLQNRLQAEVLPINHTCAATLRIRAQEMTAAELSQTCASLLNQDAYFHRVVSDPGPVTGDRNTALEVVVYNSSTDYQTYAGVMWGIDTNNGGMYLEGNPSATGNQARFIAYEAEWLRPSFQIWNLNHEYTHYLDGRFDMAGDFTSNVTTPTIWWIEGFAEYVSYQYRNVPYDAAIAEAGKRTHALSTLFDTTYSHDTTRIYRWGYLAVRYMIQSHPADVTAVLGHYRAGNWAAARTLLKTTIGSRYDNDWYTWLSACAAGSCGGGGTTNQPPVADFTSSTSGRTVTFTDRSTDSDGTIASRRWDFGDGTTSTATSPSRTYAADGSYTVRLTVTDDRGATATTTKAVTVGSSALPECTGSDTRVLGKNCQRSNRSAIGGNYDYFYLSLPSGTTQLTINASGGTGNCDLYASTSSWATTATATHRSTGASNQEAITVSSPPSGYLYISLKGANDCAGVVVTTRY